MSGLIGDVIAFVQTNAEWAAPIGFAIGFFKALAFVSLVVPGLTILLTIGALIGASHIPFLPVWIGVSLGAALGDWASYAIGFRLKDRARYLWPFSRRPELLPRAERFFARWGTMSVVLCRFFSPLRATVPLLAGMCEMPFWPFQIANWLSAFLWAGAMLGPSTLVTLWAQ
jgi:membrane protein DedA with SNARE-associated domain